MRLHVHGCVFRRLFPVLPAGRTAEGHGCATRGLRECARVCRGLSAGGVISQKPLAVRWEVDAARRLLLATTLGVLSTEVFIVSQPRATHSVRCGRS